MRKKILVIDGHPNKNSLCSAFAAAYEKGALSSGYDVQILSLRNLKFDLNLSEGYRKIQELEPDLVDSQNRIKWCEHLVCTLRSREGAFSPIYRSYGPVKIPEV